MNDLYQATRRDTTIALAHFLNHPSDETKDAAQAAIEAHLLVCKTNGKPHQQATHHLGWLKT